MRKLCIVTTTADRFRSSRYGVWLGSVAAALSADDAMLLAGNAALGSDAVVARDGVWVVRFLPDGRKVYPGGAVESWRAADPCLPDAVGRAADAWRAKHGATFHAAYGQDDPPVAWPHLRHAPLAVHGEDDPAPRWPWAFGASDGLVLDVESAGRVAGRHPLIEVGAIRVNGRGQVLAEYEARVPLDRSRPHDEEALQVNGYYQRDWSDAVPLAKAMAGLAPLLALRPKLIAHNATFDKNMLMVAHLQVGRDPADFRAVDDTVVMARRMLVKTGKIPNAQLATVCAHLGISNVGQHTALIDARRDLAVWRALSGADAEAEQDALARTIRVELEAQYAEEREARRFVRDEP